MTGEFFHLLTTKSILSSSVDTTALFGEKEQNSFRKGVQDAQTVNILHGSFMVRTNLLFGNYSMQENFYYLSGLLIGSELKEIDPAQAAVFLIGSKNQCCYYQLAFNTIYPNGEIAIIDADEATIKGHYKIYSATQRQTE
jgi:2-dehydro-3-deoxygalactonokinase